MVVSEGRKSFQIGLAVLIQYRRVSDRHPASEPATQTRCRSKDTAYYVARVMKSEILTEDRSLPYITSPQLITMIINYNDGQSYTLTNYQSCGLRPSVLGQNRSETKKIRFGLSPVCCGLGLASLVLCCETRYLFIYYTVCIAR